MKFDNGLIIFIHIPSTSGTYIEANLCKKFNIPNNADEWPKVNENALSGLKKINKNHYLNLTHLTLSEMIKFNYINEQNNQYIFTIIRNPYDRVFSLYNRWFKDYYNSLDLFLDKLIDIDLNNYNHNGIINTDDNFNYLNMVSYIDNITYFLIPQYYYIVNNYDNIYNVDIIKYEDIEILNEKLNLNLKFQKKNNNNLTFEQKQKIYKIYNIDFIKFNFNF